MAGKKTVYGIGLLFITFILLGCSKKELELSSAIDKEDIVTLRVLNIGTPPADGMDDFYNQLDAVTIPDLSCIVRFDFIPWGDERNQINIAIASGEYDFIPGGVFSDYFIMASKNAFINLYDYMPLVPELESHYKKFREDYLNNYEIDGKLYGLPQYNVEAISNSGQGFFYREDLQKEWELQPVTDFETMEAYLYRAKEEERYQDYPLITDNRIWTSLWNIIAGSKYLEVDSIFSTPYVVVSADNPTEPVSRFETPEFKQILEIVKQWYDDGILESSILVASGNEGLRGAEMMKQDQKPCETNTTFWVMNRNFIPELYEVNPNWEFEYYDYLLENAPAYLITNTSNTVTSISSKSNNKEIAIRFLEKAHTNQTYYDLLCYGVEGIHYNIIDSYINYAGIKADNIFPGWNGIGDYYMGYESQSVNSQWQTRVVEREEKKREKLAADAPYYPLDGFNMDTSNISKIYESMDEILIRYLQPLYCGVTDDIQGDYDYAVQLLKEAGLDEYRKEVRRQLKDFKAKN